MLHCGRQVLYHIWGCQSSTFPVKRQSRCLLHYARRQGQSVFMILISTNRPHSCNNVPNPSAPLAPSFQPHHKSSVLGDDDVLVTFDDHAEREMTEVPLDFHYSLLRIELTQYLILGNLKMLLEKTSYLRFGDTIVLNLLRCSNSSGYSQR